MTNSRADMLQASLVAGGFSGLFGALLWLCLDRLLPFIFILSPFFLLLSLPVSLPILYCWRVSGRKTALWAAGFSSLFLYLVLPGNFGLFLVLQLIIPAAFVAAIADMRIGSQTPANARTDASRHDFIPLSTILSTTALLVAIATLVMAAFLDNMPQLTALLDEAIREMVRILTLMRTLSWQQVIQFELLLRMDNHALVIRMFALYSFVLVALNFYIVLRSDPFSKIRQRFLAQNVDRQNAIKPSGSRLHRHHLHDCRPRDDWPYSASFLPRIHVILLLLAGFMPLLPVDNTLRNCLDIVSLILLLSFTLAGLAALHLVLRDKTWRKLFLIMVYGLIMPLFASYALALWGIFVSTAPLFKRYRDSLKPLSNF